MLLSCFCPLKNLDAMFSAELFVSLFPWLPPGLGVPSSNAFFSASLAALSVSEIIWLIESMADFALSTLSPKALRIFSACSPVIFLEVAYAFISVRLFSASSSAILCKFFHS